jgi:p-aminobenzoyl-glutamate transporter AbgT
MLTITLLENALGVDLDSMTNDLVNAVLEPCISQEQDDGTIVYYHCGFLAATESPGADVNRIVLAPYGNMQFVELLRERLKNIAMRIAVERLN